MSTDFKVAGGDGGQGCDEPLMVEPRDNSGEYLGRVMVACGFVMASALFYVATFVLDLTFGPKMLNLYASPVLGLMYWIDIIPDLLAGVSIGSFFLAFKVIFIGLDMQFGPRLCFQGVLLSLAIGGLREWCEIVSGLALCEVNCPEKVFGLSFLHFDQIKDLSIGCTGTFVVLYGLGTLFSRK